MDKRFFTTTKQILWLLNIANIVVYAAYAVALVFRGVDLSTIVTASTTITTGYNTAYAYKSYNENKQKIGQSNIIETIETINNQEETI